MDAIFNPSKIFIEIKPIDPSMILQKNKKDNKTTNNRSTKKGESVDEMEDNMDNILV